MVFPLTPPPVRLVVVSSNNLYSLAISCKFKVGLLVCRLVVIEGCCLSIPAEK